MAIEEALPSGRSDSGIDAAFEYAGYGRPYLGERLSGDVALAVDLDDRLAIALIDVLGHGPDANELAVQMAQFVREKADVDPVRMLLSLHRTFKGSRGAAAGYAVVDPVSGRVSFAGIGNPSFRIMGASRTLRFPVTDGIIGARIRTTRAHDARMDAGDLLLACSDGVSSFEVDDYPQMFIQNVMVVARTIVHRFGKDHDDSTCMVARRKAT